MTIEFDSTTNENTYDNAYIASSNDEKKLLRYALSCYAMPTPNMKKRTTPSRAERYIDC